MFKTKKTDLMIGLKPARMGIISNLLMQDIKLITDSQLYL